MSKVIYLCFRDKFDPQLAIKKIASIINLITPDNISANTSKIRHFGNVLYGIANPVSTILERSSSILIGGIYGSQIDWWNLKSEPPEGSYAIFRSDSNDAEIITDATGSRATWYYKDESVFIASSSQRAIVAFLGSFRFNHKVIPWMVSTGSLGPFHSWDSRIQLLPPDSVLRLNFASWDSKISTNDVVFEPELTSKPDAAQTMLSILAKTFNSLKLDFSKWSLPLSGGFDSRGILTLFHKVGVDLTMLNAITWGLKGADKQPGNDAYIAGQVAKHFNICHKYYCTNLSTERVEQIFSRFLTCGEGRIDHISGYMDGFKIWKDLFEDGVQGIIRGDEGFGRLPVSSESEVRKHVEMALCSDYENLRQFPECVFQEGFPESFIRKNHETLDTWRDRLYHQFRMPIVLSALTDLKLPYVEVITPLLTRDIVYETRKLPDHLRTDKALFKTVINSISPKIHYATSSATAEVGYILNSEDVVEIFLSEINSNHCKSIISEDLIIYINQNLKKHKELNKQVIKAFLKRVLPKALISTGSKFTARKDLSVNRLALRVFIISKMTRILMADSDLLITKSTKHNIFS